MHPVPWALRRGAVARAHQCRRVMLVLGTTDDQL